MSLLEIRGLKKYFGQVKAVDGISLHVDEGECIGLLGPNGAGKSTAVSMIATLLKPDAGQIVYRGIDITRDSRAFKAELGYVPQDIALYADLSGMDNMKFWGRACGIGGAELKKSIDRIADIIGLKDRLKDHVKTYSGGMKRRLNIGVALLHNPKLIILDEPTVGIDPQSRNHILETVRDLNAQGISIIYISHYMEEVMAVCRRIYIMDYGRVVADGTYDELISINGSKQSIVFGMTGDERKIMEEVQKIGPCAKQNGEYILTVACDAQVLTLLNHATQKLGSEIQSYRVEKPSLESIFLNLTGHGLRD